MANPLYQKHIISINDLSRDDLNLVLATAAKLKANPQPELLKHKSHCQLFLRSLYPYPPLFRNIYAPPWVPAWWASPTAPIHHWVKRAKR